MNFEYYIARKIHFSKKAEKNVARPAVRIATIGIAVGLIVMLLAISIVVGFKNEIRSKVIGFGGHIQITNFDNNITYEMQPVEMDTPLIQQITTIADVRHVQHFATKPGIIKTDAETQGIIVKGVGSDFDWDFFKSNLIEGNLIDTNDSLTNNILISKTLCNLLNLKLGDSFLTYFIQDEMRVRKFTIAGIYSTNFADYDKLFILCDIRQIQQLNNWTETQFGGLEVLINNFDNIDALGNKIYLHTANRFNDAGATYLTRTIKELNPQIFNWLALLDMNVWVILLLMFAVAGFSMISGLLILILERTTMIGLLKALGCTDWSVRKIFLYHSFFLIGKGMLWGNAIGLIICTLQYCFKIIPLNPEAYYVAAVPISFNWLFIILLNVITFIASLLVMLAPSYLVTKISPAKTMRYE
ncbi:MAG: FtsX-like permease family protein [Prevotellaceae bacterium]|jgi:lipoprotein-releasing system permease protein|nr:FtsX-like permease family protein [Prevotellaceae bacterium]